MNSARPSTSMGTQVQIEKSGKFVGSKTWMYTVSHWIVIIMILFEELLALYSILILHSVPFIYIMFVLPRSIKIEIDLGLSESNNARPVSRVN